MDIQIIGEIIMLAFAVIIGMIMLYGGYMITRPFELEPKKKKTT